MFTHAKKKLYRKRVDHCQLICAAERHQINVSRSLYKFCLFRRFTQSCFLQVKWTDFLEVDENYVTAKLILKEIQFTKIENCVNALK